MNTILTSRYFSRIGLMFVAATLIWLLSIFLLTITLGNYEQQITQYAESHQGEMPSPTQRANLYATSLSYLRIPGVAAEALSCIPLVFVALGVVYLYRSQQDGLPNILGILGIVSAVGSLVFWLFWTYLGMGLIIGNPAHLPPFVGDPVLNSRPNGSPILFTAGLLAIITVLLVSSIVIKSKVMVRIGLIIGALGFLMLFAMIVLRVALPPLVPHILLLPLGIGFLRHSKSVYSREYAVG